MKLPPSVAGRPAFAPRLPLAFCLTLLFACALITTRLAAGDSDDQKKKLSELWSDTPAYVRLFNDPVHAQKPARIQSTVPPVPPLVTAIPGKETNTVMVSFIVDETGGVEAARVLESDDPRYNQSALDAVLQWRFFPAEGEHGFVKSYFIVPLAFKGERAEDIAIRVAVGRPAYANESIAYLPGQTPPKRTRTPKSSIAVQLQGPGAVDVKAGRIVISHAVDDVGTELQQPTGNSAPIFYQTAVGSISPDDFVRLPTPRLSINLNGAALTAKKVSSIEGEIQLIIPRLDPAGAEAVIENFPSKIGSPLKSAVLAAAEVTVVLYDKATCNRYIADPNAGGGPADYAGGDLVGAKTDGLSVLKSRSEVSASDIAVGISDPQGQLVGLEFQTADGKPLRYDHNGWYHSGFGTASGRRFDVYKLGSNLPADARLVCWSVTPRSLTKMPLKLAELPLPESGH